MISLSAWTVLNRASRIWRQWVNEPVLPADAYRHDDALARIPLTPATLPFGIAFTRLVRLLASFRSVPSRNRAEPSLLGGHPTIGGSCNMKSILMPLAIACVSTGAMAQSGSTTLAMTCAQARGIVSSQGSVVLHTGPSTFDRYVRDGSFCALQEVARPAWIRTSDIAQCPIGGVCRSVEIDNGQ
jgi:hypothetical protein